MPKSQTDSLFVTQLYRARVARMDNAALAATAEAMAREDMAGRRWCRDHGYKGYTSYASLDDLPMRASIFEDLAKALLPHVRMFARSLDWDMSGKVLTLDSLWVNVMEKGSAHSGHIHPHSVISGTYYVQVPEGAAAIRFEDPRLPMMMAAPAKKLRAGRQNQTFVTVSPTPGTVLLWESYLRHEVLPNTSREKRISISFNYAMR